MRSLRFGAAALLAACFSLALPGHASAQDVDVSFGDLPAGKTVRIRFQATVVNPVPAGLTQVSNQGTVAWDVAQSTVTNDPVTGAPLDPTITLIDAAPAL